MTGIKLLVYYRRQDDRHKTIYSERRPGWQVPNNLLRTEARLTGIKILTLWWRHVDHPQNEIRYKDRMSSFVRVPGRPASNEILCKEANKQRMAHSVRRTSWSARINYSVRRPMNTERLTLEEGQVDQPRINYSVRRPKNKKWLAL